MDAPTDLTAQEGGPAADPDEPTARDLQKPEAERNVQRSKPPVSRRTLDAVFGDVLPDVTRDELEDRSENADRDSERWYRDNRPPHHG